MKTTAQIYCSSMALIIVSVSMFASLGIAQDFPLPPPKIDNPFVGHLPPPRGFAEFKECWSSLQNVKGCVVEINRSFLSGKIQSLEPDCCKAFVRVDAACWPKMFPFNDFEPLFPPLLRSYCALNGGEDLDAAEATSDDLELYPEED